MAGNDTDRPSSAQPRPSRQALVERSVWRYAGSCGTDHVHGGADDLFRALAFTWHGLAEDMFRFNAQVMGFGSGGWWPDRSEPSLKPFKARMEQILNSFNDIVLNAADAVRLHEECNLLSLRLDKVSRGQARLR